MATKNVLILAGGGGHTAYGYALAQRLYGRANLHILVPEGDKLSYERLSKFGTVDFLLKPREAKTPTSEFIPKLVKAFIEAFKKVPTEFDVVVSTGSNFCIPPSLFAWVKGIPIVNIESSVRFTKASKTALLLQPFSTITALHWEEQKKLLKKGIVVGPLIPKPEVKPWNGGYILVTGGTLGHKRLFDVIAESKLENVVLQTGTVNPEPYRRQHPEWKILEHSARFYELIAGADVVVTHFGATILEALVYRKPTVVVPNPEWTRTAGVEDAEHYARKINAVMVSEITLENILNAIEEARKREYPKLPDGSSNLAELILKLS
ncbi:MAG: glycosyltransferase [Candidatus Bathyarchaeota archaeon]|nr:polysaccharide biosynthesis protein [Candidatus Bathyarchaeota archaeon A05DMB-3]MDH7607311.1 glycosyltransferase [Candidatus Bathyarchaeota archaeon]